MLNILDYISEKDKKTFTAVLKETCLAPSAEIVREQTNGLIDTYDKHFPEAVACGENGLENSLLFYSFPLLDSQKI